ncbi:hypothetical protein ACFXAZ_05120 [Streptomyces sp. NPDC059477]|uniref:hypothetical protein n=1 Tax=Streptomyces sp. NPDC059477 TaxID=3346847 RepID=UPI0036822173
MDGTTEITLETLHRYASGQLARYKLPKRLKIVPVVPRNAAGKLDRARARRLADEAN